MRGWSGRGSGSAAAYQRRSWLGQKYGAVEDLLQAEDLHALLGGLGDHRQVLVQHGLLDLGDRRTMELMRR
jgi:hypothetical protein